MYDSVTDKVEEKVRTVINMDKSTSENLRCSHVHLHARMVRASHACMPNEQRVARVAVTFFSFRKDLLCHLCVYNGSVSSLTLVRKKDTLVVKIRVEDQVKVQRVFLFLIFWLKDSKKELTLSISFQLRHCCSIHIILIIILWDQVSLIHIDWVITVHDYVYNKSFHRAY